MIMQVAENTRGGKRESAYNGHATDPIRTQQTRLERRRKMASELAMQLAAQAWCQDNTSNKEMDPDLAEAFAQILDGWLDIARYYESGMELYRGLLDKCAEHLGEEAYMADDGSRMDDPIRLKIPELVGKLVA